MHAQRFSSASTSRPRRPALLGATAALLLAGATARAQSAPAAPPAAAPQYASASQGNGSPANGAGPYGGSAVYDIAPTYARVAYAHAIFDQADFDLTLATQRARHDFDLNGDTLAARRERDDAQAAYDNARRPVLDRLNRRADFIRLTADREHVEAQLHQARLSDADRRDLAARKLAYAADATRLQTEALDAEDSVRQARARLIDAQRKLDDATARFQANAYKDPAVSGARDSYNKASIDVKVADAYLQGARETRDDVRDADYRRYPAPTGIDPYSPIAAYGYGQFGFGGFGDPYYAGFLGVSTNLGNNGGMRHRY